MKVDFRGSPVTVTTSVGDFLRGRSSGLMTRISNFPETYGEIQASDARSHHISPSSGPCYIICAGCQIEFDEATMASLGTNSVMAAFGMRPVTECPECGSRDMIIVKE